MERRLHPTSTLSSVRTTAPGPRAPQSSETLVWLSERAPASQASAPLCTGRSTRMRTPTARLGPPRPSSAPLGHARLPSPPLSSSPTPYSPEEWEAPLYERRVQDAGCVSPLQKEPGRRPQRASLGRSLCLAAALPWAPKASGRRPLVLAGPPQGRGGASSGAWLGGAGRGGRRSRARGLAGQEEDAG